MDTSEHYDAAYYRSHYAHVLGDEKTYRLLAAYWKRMLFEFNGIPTNLRTLDFGCGLGQVSAGLQNVVLYDPSEQCRELLRALQRQPVDDIASLEPGEFDVILSSHSLEHSLSPASDLALFRNLAKPISKLVLVLPVETCRAPSVQADSNQHLYCWSFQTITNLLLKCGWRPLIQRRVYGPFGLRSLGRWLPPDLAVSLAGLFGRRFKRYPSQFTLAEAA